MAWCRQATSHYMGQCWPSSVSLPDMSMPQWVIKICVCLKCASEITRTILITIIVEEYYHRLRRYINYVNLNLNLNPGISAKKSWHGNAFRITFPIWGNPSVTTEFPSQEPAHTHTDRQDRLTDRQTDTHTHTQHTRTIWAPFRRERYQMHVFSDEFCKLYSNFTEVCY